MTQSEAFNLLKSGDLDPEKLSTINLAELLNLSFFAKDNKNVWGTHYGLRWELDDKDLHNKWALLLKECIK